MPMRSACVARMADIGLLGPGWGLLCVLPARSLVASFVAESRRNSMTGRHFASDRVLGPLAALRNSQSVAQRPGESTAELP